MKNRILINNKEMHICLPIACRAPRKKPSCPKSVKTRAAKISTILADRKKMAQEERCGGPSEEVSPRMRDECREISFVAEFRHFVNFLKTDYSAANSIF
jgi:hypothetical protein